VKLILTGTCICVSQIPQFLASVVIGEEAVEVAGLEATTKIFMDLVRRKATVPSNPPG
jgi:hypothetical protein